MRVLYFKTNNPSPSSSRYRKILSQLQRIAATSLLQCRSTKNEFDRLLGHSIRTRLVEDTSIASQIIIALLAIGQLSQLNRARKVFDQISQPTPFVWNSLIRGYLSCNSPLEALRFFKIVLSRCGSSPDSRTFAAVSSACARVGGKTGRQIHGMVCKNGFHSDMFVMTGLLNFYSSCRDISSSRKVFDQMPDRDVVTWTSMALGYALSDKWYEAFQVLDEMKIAEIEPTSTTFATLISACGISDGAGNRGLLRNGMYEDALNTFWAIRKTSEAVPDKVSITMALSASAQLGDLKQGKLVHAFMNDHQIRSDKSLSNALLNMYAKCGDLDRAEKILHDMPDPDVFSWTTLISEYVHENRPEEAMDVFKEMQVSGVEPNAVTLVSLLSACSQLGSLEQGRLIHLYIKEHTGVESDPAIGNALMSMYSNCGCLQEAFSVFCEMDRRDTVSWNTMISGFAAHGHGDEALNLFHQMVERDSDSKPDRVTLVAVLWACSHSGMVEKGFEYFNSITNLYGVDPSVEHYGCMVDLLSRSGLIKEAVGLIRKMPTNPNSVMWGSLLSACRIKKYKVVDAKGISDLITESCPFEDLLLCDLKADVFPSPGAKTGIKTVKKTRGVSSIEVDGEIREFVAAGGKELNFWYDEMFFVIGCLSLHLKLSQYMNNCLNTCLLLDEMD